MNTRETTLARTLAYGSLCLLVSCGGGGGSSPQGAQQQGQSRATWTFDSLNGATVQNASFNEWHIQLNSASIAPGVVGNGVSFDDSLSQSYGVIQLPAIPTNTMDFSGGKLSMALWIKPTKIELPSQYLLFGGAPSGGFKSTYLWLKDGKIIFEMQPPGGGFARDQIIQSSATLSAGAWAHIAVTYDGVTARTYINGVLDNSNLISHGIPEPNNRIYIGGAAVAEGGPLTLPGALDELQLHASALSATEVQTLASVPH